LPVGLTVLKIGGGRGGDDSGGGKRGGQATVADPGALYRCQHLRGKNLEFWRLHCNLLVLA